MHQQLNFLPLNLWDKFYPPGCQSINVNIRPIIRIWFFVQKSWITFYNDRCQHSTFWCRTQYLFYFHYPNYMRWMRQATTRIYAHIHAHEKNKVKYHLNKIATAWIIVLIDVSACVRAIVYNGLVEYFWMDNTRVPRTHFEIRCACSLNLFRLSSSIPINSIILLPYNVENSFEFKEHNLYNIKEDCTSLPLIHLTFLNFSIAFEWMYRLLRNLLETVLNAHLSTFNC